MEKLSHEPFLLFNTLFLIISESKKFCLRQTKKIGIHQTFRKPKLFSNICFFQNRSRRIRKANILKIFNIFVLLNIFSMKPKNILICPSICFSLKGLLIKSDTKEIDIKNKWKNLNLIDIIFFMWSLSI